METTEIMCASCNDNPFEVTCPTCQGNTCDCDDCATCADPSTECDTCDNTGTIQCPACYAWT